MGCFFQGRRWMMTAALAVIGGLIALFVGSDAGYSVWTHHQLKKWEQSVQRHADGVRKGCHEFSLGDGDPALLLVHGYGTCPAVYQNMAPALAERGFYCRALRLPGFGEPIPAYRQTSAEKWSKEIHRHVTRANENHDRVWLVAHSLGGAAVLQYLLNDHPDAPVDGVVLLAPAIGISGKRSPLLPARTWFELLDTCLMFSHVVKNDLPVRAHDPEVPKKIVRSKFVPRKVFREMFKTLDRIQKGSRDLDRPVLMVLARHDTVIKNDDAQQLYEQLKATRKKLIWLDKSRHIIPLDCGMDTTVRAIEAFTDRLEHESQ